VTRREQFTVLVSLYSKSGVSTGGFAQLCHKQKQKTTQPRLSTFEREEKMLI